MLQIFDMKGSTFQRKVIDNHILNEFKAKATIVTTQGSQDSTGTNPYESLPPGLEKFMRNNTETLKDIDFVNLS